MRACCIFPSLHLFIFCVALLCVAHTTRCMLYFPSSTYLSSSEFCPHDRQMWPSRQNAFPAAIPAATQYAMASPLQIPEHLAHSLIAIVLIT